MRHAFRRLALLAQSILIAAAAYGGGRPEAASPAAGKPREPPQELVLFAASSLTDVMNELAAVFQSRNPGTTLLCNYASSSALSAQLLEGEEADLFAPASETQMRAVADAGLVAEGAPVLFAANRLVVLVPASNPAGIRSFEDLGRRKLALVLAAPGVPVREYADEAVRRIGADPGCGESFRERFYANLASEESNVRQVAAKVALGEADAGIVYATDLTADIRGMVRRLAVPDPYNVTARYPIAVLRGAPQAALAEQFVRLLLSGQGRAVLSRHGFSPVPHG